MTGRKQPAAHRATAARAFLYCRQSSTSGAGEKSISLASQERMLRDLAAERGFVVVGVEVDADIRGWQDESERPGYARTLERADAGEFDVLLLYDSSRVARDLWMLEGLVRRLDRVNARLVSLTEPWLDDPLVRQVLGAVAEKVTRDLRAHASRGIAERTRRGLHHGKAPYGYVKAPDGALAIDTERPERTAVVREIFERLASGDTYTEVALDLRARGIAAATGRGWSVSTMREMVRRPVYRGALVVGETIVEDAHPAIIDDDLWQRVEVRTSVPAYHRKKRKRASSWLEGFIMHECGGRAYFVPEQTSQKEYFRCLYANGRQRQFNAAQPMCDLRPKSIRKAAVEEEVWSIVLRDLARSLDGELAAEMTMRRYVERMPDAANARREAAKQLDALERQFARAESLYIDGARSRDWLNAREAEIAERRLAVESRLAALPDEPDTQGIIDMANVIRDIAGNLADMREMPAEFRRQLMTRLGMVSYGPSGVLVWYAPDVAPLIPGARSLGGDVTIVTDHPGNALLTSLRAAYAANRATLGS